MTATTREPPATETRVDRRPSLRWWIVAVVGVAALGIGVLIGAMLDGGDDPTDEVAVPTTVEVIESGPLQAIETYNTAWEQNDPDALLAVVTDDFVEEYHWYTQLGDQVAVGGDDWGGQTAAGYASSSDYRIQVLGEPIVVGDGPWYVTVHETQQGAGFDYDGTSNYVVVDDDGTYKLVLKSWHGTRE